MKILAIILIAAGIIGLVYQGFTYTKTNDIAKIGTLDIKADTQKTVPISPFVSILAIAAGGSILLLPADTIELINLPSLSYGNTFNHPVSLVLFWLATNLSPQPTMGLLSQWRTGISPGPGRSSSALANYLTLPH